MLKLALMVLWLSWIDADLTKLDTMKMKPAEIEKRVLNTENVVEILGEDEYAKKATELLIRYSEPGKIPAEEIDEELTLLFEYYKLAIPVSSIYGSLSWNMRTYTGCDLEIPYVVRFFFKKLAEDGESSWEDAVERYFAAIGESEPGIYVRIFAEIVKLSTKLLICAEDIVDVSMKYGRDGGVVIAELKGAGLISPAVGCGRFGRAKAPLYHLNRFFSILAQPKG